MRAGVGFDAAGFGRGSKALYSSVRGAINMVPGSEDDPDCILIVPAKCNNGRLPEKRAVRRNPDTLRLEVDEDFDCGAWEESTMDKARNRENRKSKIGFEVALRGVLSTGGLVSITSLVKTLMTSLPVGKSKAYEIISEGLAKGVIQETMGALKLKQEPEY